MGLEPSSNTPSKLIWSSHITLLSSYLLTEWMNTCHLYSLSYPRYFLFSIEDGCVKWVIIQAIGENCLESAHHWNKRERCARVTFLSIFRDWHLISTCFRILCYVNYSLFPLYKDRYLSHFTFSKRFAFWLSSLAHLYIFLNKRSTRVSLISSTENSW